MNAVCTYPPVNVKRKNPDDQIFSTSQKSGRKSVKHDPSPAKGGYLSLQSGGRSRFIENSFWASVDPEGLDLDSLIFELPLVHTEPDECDAEDHDTAIGGCKKCSGAGRGKFSFYFSQYPSLVKNDCQQLSRILQGLPSRAICDDLYRNFLCAVHPVIPLIHTPTFDMQYRRFWEWYVTWNGTNIPRGVLAESPCFVALLLAVLFTGSVAGPHPQVGGISPTGQQYDALQKQLCRMTSTSLTMVGFPQNPAMASLEAYLLLQSILMREEEAVSSCSFVAVAVRIAQAMGLHRDPADFGLNPIQIEERRRVWNYLMHLDIMTSVVSGLPMMISEGMYTTRMIGELRDEHINKEVESKDGDEDPSKIHPGYVLAIGRYVISFSIREVLNLHLCPQTYELRQLEDMKVKLKELGNNMEDMIQRINKLTANKAWLSELLGVTAVATESVVEDNVFAEWGAHILRLQVSRAYGLLFQPLMQDRQMWSEVRAE